MILLDINIDSFRKVVIDSVMASQKNQFGFADYVGKIDSFYSSAWSKLAALLGLVTIVIPVVINYIQAKRNEKEQDLLKDALKKELQSIVDEKFVEVDATLNDKLVKIQHASEGVTYHIQSDMYFEKGKFREAFGETVNALTCYFIGEDYGNFCNALDDLKTRIDKVSADDLVFFKEEGNEYYDIDALMERINKSDDEKYIRAMSDIRTKLKTIRK